MTCLNHGKILIEEPQTHERVCSFCLNPVATAVNVATKPLSTVRTRGIYQEIATCPDCHQLAPLDDRGRCAFCHSQAGAVVHYETNFAVASA